MNLYILVEGKCTEFKLYPAWLSRLVPKLRRVYSFDEVRTNNYYLVSGYGIPSLIKNHLPNAILDVGGMHKKYDYLVVVLDAEELTVEERRKEVEQVVEKHRPIMRDVKLKIIVQNRCIETWLLGNREMFPPAPMREKLREYLAYYDVNENNPEHLPNLYDYTLPEPEPVFSTTARFHTDYLQEVFRERGIAYSKRNPRYAAHEKFLKGLMRRIEYELGDLDSFRDFVDFCAMINNN
ncbi:MAG: hypothetical protein AB7F23_01515 [Phycisphaerae bacterium]|jgi:hypothetical protein